MEYNCGRQKWNNKLWQERWTCIYRARIGEYLRVSKSIDGTGAPVAGEERAKSLQNSPKGRN